MPAKKLKLHFIGIGGIGISALAQYYLQRGHQISGSDLVSSEITEVLRKKGVKVFIGYSEKNISVKTNLVIYSPAIKSDSLEIKKAKKLKIKIQSYPQILGDLTKQYFTIAVSGTHGKSTTTAMLGLLLTKAGLDPTVIVGTKVKEFGNSNCRIGESQYLIIEADEHFASFLNYWPKVIVLTNIEADHLDYYKNFKNYKNAFKKFISHLPKAGILIINKNDKNIPSVIKKYIGTTYVYSLKQKEVKELKKILKVPGEHNIFNALAALAVARVLKIPDKISLKALSEYRGSWRRFEIFKILHPIPYILVSDYGHHPTGVQVTLRAAREKWPKKKIWCIFQPHQYHRTYTLFNDFVKVFKQPLIDKIIIIDIYDVTGREEKTIKKEVSSEKLVKAIKRKDVIYLPKEKIINYLKDNLRVDETSSHLEPFADARVSEEVVIIMGAGDIYDLVIHLTKKEKRKRIE